MIVLSCPTCGQQLQVADDMAGKTAPCPQCRRVLDVPAQVPSGFIVGGSSSSPPQRSFAAGGPQSPAPGGPTPLSNAPEAETLPPEPVRDYRAGLPETMAAEAVRPGTPAELIDFLAPPDQRGALGMLGPYRVLQVLGSGGMGVVYLAQDTHLERKVALKAMLPALAASPSARQRFLREARAAAALDNDHIVHIYQVGEDRSIPYLAMQLLKGESLENLLRRQATLPLAEVLRIGREIAQGLAAAHEQGLIHRDIKPANIWLEPPSMTARPGQGGRVKILDFGLARATSSDVHLTQTGAIMGTPGYMAPEQSGKGVDHRADLFSLGCILYRMATGTPAFQGTDTITTLIAVATQQPRPPRELNSAIPPGLEQLILKLLAKDPADRPPSAHAVVQTIQSLENSTTSSPISGVAGTLRDWAVHTLPQWADAVRGWSRSRKERRTLSLPTPPTPTVPPVAASPWPLPVPPLRTRPRRWRRVFVALLILYIVYKIFTSSSHPPIVVDTDNPDEAFSVRLGDKKVFEVRATALPKSALRAAEAYLKTNYAKNWTISSKKLVDASHALVEGTIHVNDETQSFQLHLQKIGSRDQWKVESLTRQAKPSDADQTDD